MILYIKYLIINVDILIITVFHKTHIMEELYSPHDIERIVQKYWDKHQTFVVTEDKNKEKYYCLSMLPYPSGHLHMGHVRNYTIGDVISRYQRMLGKNVLQPMGWDAFGLPAEQAAITNNICPSKWTYSNIKYMKNQLQSLGFSYDWTREIVTCHPEYYKWEQWFFTVLYKKGLVYKKIALVNWCSYHKTVLANEQVINNCCWRCQTKIQYKKIPQWFMKITDYAEQLLDGLNHLKYWPEEVKTMQRHWIGRSKGVNVIFKIFNSDKTIVIYMTRLDIFMGLTYLTISIDHPIALKEATNNSKLKNFIQINSNFFNKKNHNDLINIKKKGFFTKIYALHPITHTKLPIWVANFIIPLESDGIGAVASCPAHNQQDWEFAQIYHLPIFPVIKHVDGKYPDIINKAMTNHGILYNSGKFNELTSDIANNLITKTLINKGLAISKISYRLKDWGVSRQRYWGVPIPMITLKNGMIIPVPINQLPVTLPENVYLKVNDNILNKYSNWKQTIYKNQIAFRDTDTFDTFMESSWYYARYTCPNYHNGMLDVNAAKYWLPIDQYIGGIEHAIMHLLYFRFYHKLMRDTGLISSDEPAVRLLCQGMILADSFYYLSNNNQKIWISPADVTIIKRNTKGHIIDAIDTHGNHVFYGGMCKMSKSKNNGIDPNIMIQKYGADAVRFFIMFAAPVNASLEWKESGIIGAQRFLKRVWNITYQHIQSGLINTLQLDNLNYEQKSIRHNLHKTIIKVTEDIDQKQSFNTALSSIMKLINILYYAPKTNIQDRSIIQEALLIIVQLLYPFTPHISFILWKALGNSKNIDFSKWPVANNQAIQNDTVLIIIQVNGKTRKKILVPKNSNQDTILKIAKQSTSLNKSLMNKQINKIIYIPNKIINFIIT